MVSHIDFTARGGTLHASGASREVRFALKGINWFGAEGKGAVVDGLWARPLGSYLDEIARLGFNAIRLPLAVDNVLDNPEVDRWSLTADDRLRGLRSLDIVERLVAEASARGLLVLLDMHRLRAAVWPDPRGLWYEADEGRPLEHGRPRAFRLRAAWRLLAHRFCSHWNVVGADLFNEPWGATWGSGRADTDWAAAAEALGDEVLAECARWLIFIEGVGDGKGADSREVESKETNGRSEGVCELCFWGENLIGLNRTQVELSVAGRAVYSPHVYGPATDPRMYYFDSAAFPSFPANMPQVWRQHWLEPARQAGATLVVGEWGGRYTGRDRMWGNAMRQMLLDHRLSSFFWALNPNSGDTGGLLKDDWRSPEAEKRALLAPLPSTPTRPLLDGLEAFACPRAGATLQPHEHNLRFFRCGSDQPDAPPLCIHLQQACNGVHECPDMSDERRSLCRELSRSPPCVTATGSGPYRRCALPFVYRGERFNACSLDDTVGGMPWCPTALNEAGAYAAYSDWGECGPGCDVEEDRRLSTDGCVDGEDLLS